ncbi:UNVERIFIED_CONTAM: hypothetical protein RMT77_011457 [Armadillidium vulgare]
MEIKNYFKFRKEVANAPLKILRQKTKQIFAIKLDSRKVLLTKNQLHRDWRGLAEITNLESSVISSGKISYTEHLFHLWIQKGGATIQDLWNALESIDRYDVIEDTLSNIYEDYDYASNSSIGLKLNTPIFDEDIQTALTIYDSNILTTDDQENLRNGGTLQYYDALILFADEDLSFVEEMVQKLEGEYGMKLVLKDRDMVGGLSFELSAIVRLIKERCARVIVVLSPAFLQSNENSFLTRFTSHLSVDQQRRILIPCQYSPCQKPDELAYYHSLDYFRLKDRFDFWKRLAESVVHRRDTRSWNRSISEASTPVVREITGSSTPLHSPSNLSTSSQAVAHSRSPSSSASQNSSSHGIISKLRGKARGGVKTEQRKHTKTTEVTEKESEGLPTDSGFSLSLPFVPSDDVDDDKKSFRSGGSRSPTSPTFLTAPLLDNEQSHKHGKAFRSIAKKFKKFKLKKELAF